MANWNLPTLSDLYDNVVSLLKDRDLDLAQALDPASVTVTNPVSGMMRFNSAENRWEKFDGTTWNPAASTYAISVDTADSWNTGRTISLTGDVSGASGSFDGSADLGFPVTLVDSGVTAGTYGADGSRSVPIITVDGKGRLTAASTWTLGTMATQNANAVALTGGSMSGVDLTLKGSVAPAPTADGAIQWDTDNDRFAVGDGTGTQVFSSDSGAATLTNKTLGSGTVVTGNISVNGQAVTPENLSYLAGATSNIQNQINTHTHDGRYVRADQASLTWGGNTIWHSGNDGAGSGLDADSVDGWSRDSIRARSNHTGTQPMSTISDAGALATLNAVGGGQIYGGSIAQGHLKTTTGVVSYYRSGGLVHYNYYTLPGGSYGFWPQVRSSSSTPPAFVGGYETSSDATGQPLNRTTSTSYIAQIGLGGESGTYDYTIYAMQRYVQASPPYDLGDGEVPIFVFALVDKSGAVVSTYVAEDPPWANNGPTNIRADVYKDGRAFQYVRDLSLTPADVAAGRASMVDYLAARSEARVRLEEITQAKKQADMGLIPHPFDPDLTDHSVILLDPPAVESLHVLHQDGEEVGDLLYNGHLVIDNTGVQRKTPPGVKAVALRWKNTAGK